MDKKSMAKRKIVEIDEEKCNGCGMCIPNCREGALAIINGKAKLIRDQYCDGLGACLGHCPQGAINIIERDAEDFDEEAVALLQRHVQPSADVLVTDAKKVIASGCPGGGCPSAQAINLTQRLQKDKYEAGSSVGTSQSVSELRNWPVQLMLVPVNAPYLYNVDLLLAADCVATSLPDFHQTLLKGKVLLIACPKLDNTALYTDKLAQIFSNNKINSLTIAHMEVPCCFGLKMIVEDAIQRAGKDIKINEVVVSIEGQIKTIKN